MCDVFVRCSKRTFLPSCVAEECSSCLLRHHLPYLSTQLVVLLLSKQTKQSKVSDGLMHEHLIHLRFRCDARKIDVGLSILGQSSYSSTCSTLHRSASGDLRKLFLGFDKMHLCACLFHPHLSPFPIWSHCSIEILLFQCVDSCKSFLKPLNLTFCRLTGSRIGCHDCALRLSHESSKFVLCIGDLLKSIRTSVLILLVVPSSVFLRALLPEGSLVNRSIFVQRDVLVLFLYGIRCIRRHLLRSLLG